MRALVTGGAGFIGGHLCRRLRALGHEVTCVDDLSTGSEENLQDLRSDPGFRFLKLDVTEPFAVGADRIYNLACPASPPHYQRDPIKTAKTSVMGALHALELARKAGARVLQASTSEVYGDPAVHPQPESYWGNVNPVGKRACYDESKRLAETLMTDYARHHGVQVRVARIFNTYGPGMRPDDGRVVSNFIVQGLRGEPLTLYGDGAQTRSFCYVSDLVEGLIRLMESDAGPAPVNLGNPGEFTVRELAERVSALLGRPAEFIHRPLPEDDPSRRRPDISRAKSLLGWEPGVTLAEGLPRTIEHFRQKLSAG
jgi:UDP-glucuronate decarboxylase